MEIANGRECIKMPNLNLIK